MKINHVFFPAIMLCVFALGHNVDAATINLGGVKLRLPGIIIQNPNTDGAVSQRAYSMDPRWHVVVQDAHSFATNERGVWIGYDEAGSMVMQIELAVPSTLEPKSVISAQLAVNGRYFDTVQATLANENLVVVYGNDVERILGRLMSGTTISIIVDKNAIETHLKGSSAAIRTVRKAAALQRRLYAEGKVTTKQATSKASKEATQFFVPGVQGTGATKVWFNIVEGTGLVLYVNFSRISNQSDPEYDLPLTASETGRVVELIKKAEDWTKIARKNRVGLFSKRLGFFDDINGSDENHDASRSETPTNAPAGALVSGMGDTGKDGIAEPAIEKSTSPQDVNPPVTAPTESASEQVNPKDFKAVNFNSYEDGTTSVQIEHSVRGFSRRFNLSLEDAQKLAVNLETTFENASFRLEKRGFDLDEKDKLFQ